MREKPNAGELRQVKEKCGRLLRCRAHQSSRTTLPSDSQGHSVLEKRDLEDQACSPQRRREHRAGAEMFSGCSLRGLCVLCVSAVSCRS
jgi:hypothetical protein